MRPTAGMSLRSSTASLFPAAEEGADDDEEEEGTGAAGGVTVPVAGSGLSRIGEQELARRSRQQGAP